MCSPETRNCPHVTSCRRNTVTESCFDNASSASWFRHSPGLKECASIVHVFAEYTFTSFFDSCVVVSTIHTIHPHRTNLRLFVSALRYSGCVLPERRGGPVEHRLITAFRRISIRVSRLTLRTSIENPSIHDPSLRCFHREEKLDTTHKTKLTHDKHWAVGVSRYCDTLKDYTDRRKTANQMTGSQTKAETLRLSGLYRVSRLQRQHPGLFQRVRSLND